MNAASAEPHPARWSRTRWLTLIALVFAAHVGFIFAFGAKKQIASRTVENVPQLKLADNSSELVALDDPTLFALPHANDFAAAVWLKMPAVAPPSFRWTEPPRWLPVDPENLGATFVQFMQTNRFTVFQFNFKPEPELNEPVTSATSVLPQNSTLQITGELAQRQLLSEINLPSLPYNDVIAPSRVQALVGTDGNVISAVLLPPGNGIEATARYDVADQRALETSRGLRFAPAPRITFGELIFNWHAVPMTATNAP